jgi:glycosyltransferase involved in cell wall biosynthesis
MKVTFVLPHASLSGGIRVVAIYATELHRRGHEVTVVSLPPKAHGRRQKLLSHLRVAVGLPWKPSGPSHLDGCGFEHRLLRTHRPVRDADLPDADVVIATWWETAEWVSRLSDSKGAKAYFIQGYEAFPEQPKERVDATWRLGLHKITIANWLVRKARDEFGDADVSFVPNSVDLTQFRAPPRTKQAVPTVGYLYSHPAFKGSQEVATAVAMLRQRVPQLRVVSFGAHQPTEELPLAAGCEFTYKPPQERIADLYASADVWLCGSRSEGFHLALLEAMACRTPVVSTAIGGAEESITPGINGAIVPIGDVEALAQRAYEVLTLSPPEWERWSLAARQRAESYTWSDATDRFEAVLTRLSAGRGVASGGMNAGAARN